MLNMGKGVFMKNISLSIVIPTYNRKDTLKKCITNLFQQTYPKTDFEILIIDDGSTDGTDNLVKEIIDQSPVQLRYFKQENKGPAAARNVGIKNAKGKDILFMGDDIIATPTLIDEHIKWHRLYPDNNVAILGYITWSPNIKVIPFLEYLEQNGVQFGYPLIGDPDNVPYNFFYTSNISVRRYFLLKYGLFDEDFPYASWEDIELAYRLKKFGLRIIYNRYAVVYHEHYIDKRCFGKRAELSGRSLAILHQKHPELIEHHPFNEGFYLKKIVKVLIWKFPAFIARLIPKKYLYMSYSYMISRYVKQGYQEYQKHMP